MRGRSIILIIVLVFAVFFNFWNANKVLGYTRLLSTLEKTQAAEKNINTEMWVEHDDLRSGKHIASLVRIELGNFVPRQQQGKIIYIHEPGAQQEVGNYCIVDLIASKAIAKEVQVILD
ncbi:MAG: hypothetical protein Q8M98_02500 [Candidatus Cloacimonadaceae bacterium]|nr:hypothetical protein [Candidatus Cloacimonadaceae bacterium]MDP3113625.1 hypothetical protein [Candidatus Cloacimonadaceae bacterium]